MRIKLDKLIHLPVITKSGQKLGHIQDMEIEIETHRIVHYHVGHRFIGRDEYMISPVQVISITEEKMIVDDASIGSKKPAAEKAVPSKPAVGGLTP